MTLKSAETKKLWWIKDVAVPLLVAIIALPIGMMIESYKGKIEVRLKHEEGKCGRTADYLESIAASLEAMEDDFNKAQVPHRSGAMLNATVELFDEKAEASIGQSQWQQMIKPLKDVAFDAEHKVDPVVDKYFISPDGKQQISAWNAKADHVIGILRAHAAAIRAEKEPCP